MTNKRILLVEDDDEVGPLLTHVLVREGYGVDLATTAAEAWALLDTQWYDRAIVDWKLPDGNGLTIADAAEQVGSKAIVMNGYLFQMPGGRAAAQETLMKPIRPGEMLYVVQRAIGTALNGA